MKTSHKKSSGRPARFAALLGAAALVLTGCTGTSGTDTPATALSVEQTAQATKEFLTAHGLEGLSSEQIIDHLEAVPVAERSQELLASVQPTTLVLSDASERELTLPLPAEDFYLSVAPFVSRTHDCHFHSLSTCLGELSNTEVRVIVTDRLSAQTLIDETRTTFDNGFVGLWLPKGIEATLTIEVQGRSATTEIATTSEQDATCLTTMQLS